MDIHMVSFLLMTAVIGLSSQQSQPIQRCLLSRLDHMPCIYQNKKLERAGLKNEYSIHYTNLRNSASGGVECNVRASNQSIRGITNFQTRSWMVIYSPGFITRKRYDDELLVQYNFECDEDQLAFFNVTDIGIQGKDCQGEDGKPKCEDYILIDRGNFGTTELCGNRTSNDSILELQSRNFTVYFRSSEERNFTGFQMYVTCFNPENRNIPGCLRPSDFNRSVCTGGIADNITDAENKRKREAQVDGLTYRDLFPNYPHGLRVKEDVANFHSQWYHQKRQATEDVRFITRLILFNETVNYTKSTIIITDSDDAEIDRFEDILVLQTFDAEGETTNYIRSVSADRDPHFFGPGPMIITERLAYFQMFVIDPRGLIPTPEEEQDLIAMTSPLLDAIPPSLDTDFIQTNQERVSFPFLSERRRQDDNGSDTLQRRKRQGPEADEFPELAGIEFSEGAVFTALQNLEACNPVLRSQAIATLQIFERTNGTMLQELRNFNISCNLAGSQLSCSVNEGFAPALDLPQSTNCTINDEPTTHQPCNPFYGQPAELQIENIETVRNVTVESINCNGQRVKHRLTVMTES